MKLLLLTMGLALTTQLIMAQVPSYVPTNGLVGYWPFEGNAIDASTNANNGTVNGAALTADRFGNANSAYTFNGLDNYINVLNSNSLSPVTSISISAWVKIRSTQNFDRIINKSHNVAQNYATYQLITGNSGNNKSGLPGATLRFGTGNSQSTNDYMWSGEQYGYNYVDIWQFIVITWNGSLMKFYQNGIPISTRTKTGLLNYTNGDLQFGKGTGGTGLPQFYKGEIDDIGIWNRALSQEEILNLYYAENTCQSLVINTGLLGFNPLTYNNTVTIYPNPANDHITIDCGNLANVSGWNIKIVNTLGQEVFSSAMNTQQYVVPLNTWSGQGIYFVKIYDASNNLMNTKKIILQ